MFTKRFSVFPKKKGTLSKIPFFRLLIVSIVLSLLTILSTLLSQKYLPPEVPLYYGYPDGKDQLAPSIMLLIPSVSSFLFLVVNGLIAMVIEDEFLKKSLVIASFAITFIATVTTLKIIFLVGSF